jgi:hypothetical protein
MRLPQQKKIIVYQVLLGYLEIKIQIISLGAPLKKMVGKFNDFTDKALDEIKALGATYIWYTGSHIMHWWGIIAQLVFQMTTDVVKEEQALPTLLRIITMLILISLLVQQIG